MSLVAPDILAEAVGFSAAVSGPIFALGLLLWLLGWRAHRFWIVLISTVAAGIVGLRSGTAYASQPVVAGLLLAVAAGAMALALARLVAFAAGGMFAALAVHALAPQWQQPLVSFLTGGLLALLMFRVWTMALTSAVGTLLMAYSGLCLVSTFAKVDVVALAEKRATAMWWICGGIVILGLIGQLVLDRRRGRGQRPSPERRENPSPPPSSQRPWWSRVEQLYRRAG
jgi:hypothetical protein